MQQIFKSYCEGWEGWWDTTSKGVCCQTWIHSLGPTGWKERTSSYQLSPDLYPWTVTCIYTNKINKYLKTKQKKKLGLTVSRCTLEFQCHPSSTEAVTHIVASQHSQMESQQLQGDHTENALQAVHWVGHLDCPFCVLNGLGILLITDHDWAPLGRKPHADTITRSTC